MVEYNKIYKKRDGRVLVASGPREAQKRQKTSEIPSTDELNILRDEVNRLRSGMGGDAAYADDLAAKLDEAIEEVTVVLEKRYLDRISMLQDTLEDRNNYIVKLETRIDKQDNIIQKLTSNIGAAPAQSGASPDEIIESSSRPNIDKIFIDPTSKGSEDKLESHVKTRETKSAKPTTSSNINKLKNLMGSKLPT